MVNVKETTLGKNVQRKNFAKINEVLSMPNLIEVQKNSYKWFREEGLQEVLRDSSGIVDHAGKFRLDYVDGKILDQPVCSIKMCKDKDATYAAPLVVKIRLTNLETGTFEESYWSEDDLTGPNTRGNSDQKPIFMGDFPLMTDAGTFVINGAERVIVSQLVRSPGVYYKMDHDKSGKELFSSTVIPNRGAWLEYENDINDVIYVRIDKTRKMPVTTLLRALGLGSDEQIRDMFGDDERITATFEKDTCHNTDEALIEVYRKLHPGEPTTAETSRAYLESLFLDPRKYDISRVGRYKYNKKLGIAGRLANQKLRDPIADPMTGELLAEAGEVVTRAKAEEIQRRGVSEAVVITEADREVKILSNGMVDINDFVNFDAVTECEVNEMVRFSTLREILEQCGDDELLLRSMIRANINELIPRTIIYDDIFASINYMICLACGLGLTDDIDHLGNRRIRCVGELLQNQLRIGFSRLERVVRERFMLYHDTLDTMSPEKLINIRPVVAAIREFFGSSPLSQFMDQTNPLAELTHKRRLSALGPGGLSRERAGFEVRDVHYSHYGRMCPIETPEGPNIGLISYLATYARINEYGFVETPFRRVDKVTRQVTDEVVYMTADVEDEFIVAQANEPLDDEHRFVRARVNARHRDEYLEIENERIDFMDVSPKMVVSVATAMIPFLENDDANRALMGANMQRQAVPLLKTEAPIVGTGMEYKAAVDSGVCVVCHHEGTVRYVSADKVIVERDNGVKDTYNITKFLRSNQGTCFNQVPVVSVGERLNANDVIADGPATNHGEISLGKNALIGFMTWEGYNYEDAVLLSEKLVRDDVFTSIHIEEYDVEARDTKLGAEEITREIPNVGEDALKNLDATGVIYEGAEVRAGDILVGKVTPKGETELTAEERLLRAIFGEKAREVRDTSLRVPHGEYGIVIKVDRSTRETASSRKAAASAMGANGLLIEDNDPDANFHEELGPGVNEIVRCYIAQRRKISVGDKMAGRHGNKGVVSRILPVEDMPFLPDGTPLDIVLNPLGVPSRMNIGQVLEVHLGRAAGALGWKVMTPVFDGAHEEDIREALKLANLREDGKTELRDGRTGLPFDNPVTVGYMYFLKLHHLVDDKIHARSTGPYSIVTQQPLGGKAQFGGQRFGEMEVWALEAYGAAYTLQEILTVKSDDVVGRVKTYEAIVKGQNVPTPGIPESFKVLIKELQSLCLDIRVLDKDNNEIDLKRSFEEDDEEEKLFQGDDAAFDEQSVMTDEDRKGFNEVEPEDELDAEDEFGDSADDLDMDDMEPELDMSDEDLNF